MKQKSLIACLFSDVRRRGIIFKYARFMSCFSRLESVKLSFHNKNAFVSWFIAVSFTLKLWPSLHLPSIRPRHSLCCSADQLSWPSKASTCIRELQRVCLFVAISSLSNMSSRRARLKLRKVFKDCVSGIIPTMIELLEDELTIRKKRLWSRKWRYSRSRSSTP
jgi:hypothetical protein